MAKKFSQFVEDNIVRQGDISVGLRDGENAQFDFPGDGIKDVDGNYLYKYRTAGDTATNWVEFTNSLTGQPVIVASDGTDENVSLVVKSHADGTLFLISPQNGDIDIALGGSGNINFETNAGFLYVNETDPYDAVSDDTTLAADSSTTLVTQHAVKTYVDGHISTSNFFISTLVASTADFDATYDNGISGVGATLTANNNGAASIDGVSLALGNIVLFKDQASALENGVYVVTQVGDFSNPAIYERYIYFDDSAEIKQGYTTFTVDGTINAKKGYQVISVVNTIGVDDIDYQQLTIPTLASSTDNAIVRFDGTSGGQVQNSLVTIDDVGVMSGATQINVDNIRLDGNTISTTNANGDLTIEPNGTGAINLDSTQVFITEALIHAGDSNNNITFGTDTQTFNMGGSTQLDLDATGLRIGGANARVDRILTDVTMAAAADTNLYTGLAIKTYVDNHSSAVAEGYFNGSILEVADFQVSSDGATITATLEKDGGGDLSLFFSTGIYVLDCTPAASVTLTPGSDQIPRLNYVYVPISTKVLTVDITSWPSEEYIPIARVYCQSAATLQTDGAYGVQNFINDITGDLDLGHSDHLDYWVLYQYPTWQSGVIISTSAGFNLFSISTTSGVVLGLHPLSYPAFDTSSGSHVYLPNYQSVPYYRITDLRDITFDAFGNSLDNTYYNLVIWGSVGVNGTQMYINLPTGAYTNLAASVKDILRTAVYNFGDEFRGTGFLIARLTMFYDPTSGGTWQIFNNEDLRGLTPKEAQGTNWGFMGELYDDPNPTLGNTLLTSGYSIESTSGDLTLVTDGISAIDLDSNTVRVGQDIVHAGDTNNKITFGTDTQDFQTGGVSRLDISDLGVRLGATDARITSISDDTTMAADSSTLGVTQHAAKTYADSVGGGAVTLSNAGTTSLVNDGTGPSLATKGLVAGTGMGAFGTSATDVTINLSIPVSIANGGTNSTSAIGASGTLARSNGTSYTFTTATYPATAGTTGTIMRSDGTNWVNTTTTYPATTSVNRILYASSANVVGQILLGTSAVLICNNTGAPSWTTLSNGQLIIGSTAGTPTAATLTAGTGVTITNGSGSITIAASGGGMAQLEVTGTSQSMAVNTRYIANNAGLVTLTMPATMAVGDVIEVWGKGAGLYRVQMNGAGQTMVIGTDTTTANGSATATQRYDVLFITCLTANTLFSAVPRGAFTTA